MYQEDEASEEFRAKTRTELRKSKTDFNSIRIQRTKWHEISMDQADKIENIKIPKS